MAMKKGFLPYISLNSPALATGINETNVPPTIEYISYDETNT